MISTVVFDMDGVLCRYHIDRRLSLLARWSGRRPDEIFASIFTSGFEDGAERGILSADEYLSGFGDRMGYALTAAQWVEARRIAIEPVEDVLSLARRLSLTMPVGVLTNNPFLLKRHLAEVFPAITEIFGNNAVVSAELGCSKPDPEAFRRLARRFDAAPAHVLYFDDTESYVDGAHEAGLIAVHVHGADDVRAELVRRNLLSAPDGVVVGVVDPRAEDVQAVLARHLAFARENTPPEGVFALPADGLLDPAITLFGARHDGRLVAVGALKEVDVTHVELKSMHTLAEDRKQGIGRAMVEHLLRQARTRGYTRVSLETGSMDAFIPARNLYASVGFTPCGRFGDYPDGPTSAFMTFSL